MMTREFDILFDLIPSVRSTYNSSEIQRQMLEDSCEEERHDIYTWATGTSSGCYSETKEQHGLFVVSSMGSQLLGMCALGIVANNLGKRCCSKWNTTTQRPPSGHARFEAAYDFARLWEVRKATLHLPFITIQFAPLLLHTAPGCFGYMSVLW